MFQLRAPKCPNCRAPMKVGREVVEMDCGFCGAHVQVRKPNTQKPAPQQQPPQQQRPQQSNRSWKRQGPLARPPGVAVAIGLSALGFVGSSVVAALLLFSVDSGGEAVASQAQTKPLAAAITGTESPSDARVPEVAVIDREEITEAKKKSKKRGRRKTKEESRTTHDENHTLAKLTKAQAGKILRSVRMLHCSASGKTRVSIVIAASGAVQSAQVSAEMPDSESRCISDTVKALRFPPSIDGLHTSQRYSW